MSDTTSMDTGAPSRFDPVELRQKYRAERDKRLRPDGDAQYLDVSGDYADFAADPYLESSPGGRSRAPQVADVDTLVLGGGWSGLQMAVHLHKSGATDFLIVDQAGDFGGVWYWNRYPGVRCDIESYIYMPLLEEVGTVPTEKYAGGPEMLEHARAIGRHYDLYSRALLGTTVTDVAWSEELSRWVASTDRHDTIHARFITIGTGPLSRAKLPGIKGIEKFQGQSFHSSRWDYGTTGGDWHGNLDKLSDKRVALIGTGASSIQILPHLAASAQHVYLFQRTPAIVNARNNRPTDPDWFRGLEPGWQRKRMDNFVETMSGRPVVDLIDDEATRMGRRVSAAMNGPGEVPDFARVQAVDFEKMEEIRRRVTDIVADASTAESLKPWYDYFCKRPLFSDDYFPAFNNDNVTLVDTDGRGVDHLTEHAVVVDGVEYDVDLIIYSTGFDAIAHTYKAGGYRLTGRGGISLAEHWQHGMRSLHGMMTSRFPNLFLIGGVEQAAISTNLPHVASRQADHVAALVARFLRADVAFAEVTVEAEQRWAEEMTRMRIDRSTYEMECTPSYYNNEGKRDAAKPSLAGAQYGGGPIGYLSAIEDWAAHHIDRDITITKGQTMPTTPHPAATQTFMAVGTLRNDTDFAEFAALREDEQKQLEVLRSEGRIGAHYVSPARRATFLELIATDERRAMETLATLPFARFFDVDIYPAAPPDPAEIAHRARSLR
ncbi:NAD(P)/FAD-dependent oxidoreductase [Nocardia sp. NEAU-G5]|uniref:NAD(P)/FAD-dependent oxidoreductase n=1 Tax=Nocardia albiluteola TaxID=2842303 RepID=A0ABS6B5H5_9NOCA|nr:NAD(P)/FAD-dependent oxidoreductase [Nocardia albiluteola]MBU3062595.1 NAD(P)/FAD-dependent oxidoreductase [Nocardia albiluteola]MBU3065571.1 NAD(P)/FAD-dependent oxidoreductase [Nocardia albiluteola]